MKKTIFRILVTIIIIIVCFMIGLQISNVFKNNVEETLQENESFQSKDTYTSKENLEEKIHTDGDIEATKKNSFLGIIAEIDIFKKQITVENPSHLIISEIYKTCEWKNTHKVTINDKTYVKAGYVLSLNNVPIREYNGEKIEIHDLKIGDNINVSTKNIEYTNKLIYETLTSDNIILIERKVNNIKL